MSQQRELTTHHIISTSMKELSGTAVPGFLYKFDIAKFKQTIRDTINLDRLVCQSIDNPVFNKKFFLYSKLYFILEHVNNSSTNPASSLTTGEQWRNAEPVQHYANLRWCPIPYCVMNTSHARHCCDTLTNLRHAIPEPQYLLITNIIL